MLEIYLKSNENATEALRKWATQHKNRPKPHRNTLRKLVEKFRKTGSVADDAGERSNKNRTVRTPEIIEQVDEIIRREPSISTRRLAQQLGLSASSVCRILKDDLKMYPYRLQVHQRLNENSMTLRYNFAADFLELDDSNQIDPSKIIFSDEAHFWLDGYINSQNFRVWGTEKPQLTLNKPLHPKKVTAWCAMSSKFIIGPYFFEGSIDSASYRKMLEEYFLPRVMRDRLNEDHYFQQDGASPHVTEDNLRLLNGVFGPKVISRRYPDLFESGLAWPPYSPDLNPLDFFLWGYLKDKIFKDAPKTINELRRAIADVVGSVPAESCGRTSRSFEKRLRYLITVDGGYVETILS